MRPIVVQGDARGLPLPSGSVHAVVCDPPYELGFMGKGWDSSGVAFDPATWREALRVLRPGGYLLAFGGTRTYHRLTVAIEDAGFEIRDSIGCLLWTYGQGFPKSLDVSKAIDKAAGAKREVVGPGRHRVSGVFAYSGEGRPQDAAAYASADMPTIPATDAAVRWQGWGTALKPAWEPIVVARKPFAGSVASNVLTHGTGAMNLAATRVGTDGGTAGASWGEQPGVAFSVGLNGEWGQAVDGLGRWPTNLVLVHHPDCADVCVPGCHVAEMDRQSGTGLANRPSRNPTARNPRSGIGWGFTGRQIQDYADTGGASRFFPQFRYEAKADSNERPSLSTDDGDTLRHTTVKPVDLMRWLIRLVTPPGGTVLDSFAGSGSTLQAAQVEGVRSIGVELDPGHIGLIRERLTWPVRVDRDGEFERIRPQKVPDNQPSLLDLLDGTAEL